MDLPLHPLIAHSSVVLVPAAAILLVIGVFFRRARGRVAVVGVVAAVLGAVSAYFSMISGENLADVVGTPDDHARWGFYVVYSAGALAVLGLVWLILASRQRQPASGRTALARRGDSTAVSVFGTLTVLAAVAATTFMILIGHSGAEAVWSGVDVGNGP